MIRAINKRILEIKHDDNNYFEKAIFFINPNKYQDDYSIIKSADNYIKSFNDKCKKKIYKKKFLYSITRFIIGIIIGVSISTIIYMINF